MIFPRFTLWSALVFLTACGLLFTAATGSLVALFLYFLVLIASLRFFHFSSLHPVLRFIILSAITTPPLLLMFIVFMPAGFAGVTYMGLVVFVFLGLFVAVAVMEESLTINLLVLSLFWFSMCVFHVLNPGTAPGRWERIVDGLLTISLLAAVHLVIQLALSFALRNVRVGLQHGVAAEQVTVSSSNSVDLVN